MQEPKTTITFLGTSSVVPGGGHDTASFVVNDRYLVDTGWYAIIKMRCYGIDPMGLEYLFLTHCHHDHYIGLPHVLFYLAMRRRERPSRPPLKIAGPAEDLEMVVDLARQFLQVGRFPDVDVAAELVPLRPGDSLETGAFSVSVARSVHPVPALCYRFTDARTGAAFAFTGDTAYDPGVVAHVRGVPLLITEASFGPDPAPEVNRSLHMGASDAARLAAEAGVGRLALVHCIEDRQDAALEAARAIFPDTFWPEDGETVIVPGNAPRSG